MIRHSHHGEVDRKFIGVLCFILIVMVFLGLLLSRQTFSGKAVEGTSGTSLDILHEGDELRVVVTTSEQIAGISFTLLGVPCDRYDSFTSPLGWEYAEASCSASGSRLDFGTASAADRATGGFTAAAFLFSAALPDPIEVTLQDVQGYTSSGTSLFPAGAGQTFILSPAASEDSSSSSSSSSSSGAAGSSSSGSSGGSGGGGGGSSGGGGGGGSGGGSGGSGGSGGGSGETTEGKGASSGGSSDGGQSLTCTQDWQCSEWSDCRNGRETRSCTDLHDCLSTKVINGKSYPVKMLGSDRPLEQRVCDKVEVEIEEPASFPSPSEEKVTFERLWEEEKATVIAVPTIVLLLVIGLLFYYLYRKE